MNKQENRKLAKLICDRINESNSFRLVEVDDKLEGFPKKDQNKPCHGAYLIENENSKYWFLFINWRPANPEEYYLVIYPEDRNKKTLAQFHEVNMQKNGSEFEWKYSPSKQDRNNDRRRGRFKMLEGTLDVRIALPKGEITSDDFLRNVFNVVDSRQKTDDLDEDIRGLGSLGFSEGKRIEKMHKARERNRKVIQLAKQEHAKKHKGRLPCEICGFDFSKKYGKEIGDCFLEAHHKTPLSKLDENQGIKTTISDLAMVCANCHRMLHKPQMSVEKLSIIVKGRSRQ